MPSLGEHTDVTVAPRCAPFRRSFARHTTADRRCLIAGAQVAPWWAIRGEIIGQEWSDTYSSRLRGSLRHRNVELGYAGPSTRSSTEQATRASVF